MGLKSNSNAIGVDCLIQSVFDFSDYWEIFWASSSYADRMNFTTGLELFAYRYLLRREVRRRILLQKVTLQSVVE